jgi:hypothetical protein
MLDFDLAIRYRFGETDNLERAESLGAAELDCLPVRVLIVDAGDNGGRDVWRRDPVDPLLARGVRLFEPPANRVLLMKDEFAYPTRSAEWASSARNLRRLGA